MENHLAHSHRQADLAPGISVEQVVRAESTAHVVELLSTANVNRLSIVPFGGCRSIATGNPMHIAHFGLDMKGLSGILAYEPADLTISVQAGTTMAEIQAELGAHGQELPVDVPHPADTTVGGLVATGFAGPRRLRSGSLRDLLIGCEFVRGDGLLAKAGGMVVKNVSGFEIPRFLHGSWGALAVLTSVNLKVTPKARAEGTVAFDCDHQSAGVDDSLRLIQDQPLLEACTVIRNDLGTRVAARFVGRPPAVKETLDAIRQTTGRAGTVLETDASIAFWQELVDLNAERSDAIVVAFNTRPRNIAALVAQLDRSSSDVPGVRTSISPGLGSARLCAPLAGIDGSSLLVNLARVAGEFDAGFVVESAPPELRSIVPAWGTAPDGIAVMRSIKQQFDPAGILNPGRLFV